MATIIIFCAHSDDEAVGIGGTIQKYLNEGFNLVKVVFSYGEGSQPHLQRSVIIKKRVEEAKETSDLLGIKHTIFLGLTDGKINEEIQTYNIIEKVKRIIQKYKPDRIFCPSEFDPHPDHKAVNDAILKAVDGLKKPYPVFTYEVWNVITEEHPALYIDITPYLKKKIEFMKRFKSQKHFMYALMIPVILRARWYGFNNHFKYAEKFYRVR